jgi:hypothetical protein
MLPIVNHFRCYSVPNDHNLARVRQVILAGRQDYHFRGQKYLRFRNPRFVDFVDLLAEVFHSVENIELFLNITGPNIYPVKNPGCAYDVQLIRVLEVLHKRLVSVHAFGHLYVDHLVDLAEL